jgi:hypothetical protein
VHLDARAPVYTANLLEGAASDAERRVVWAINEELRTAVLAMRAREPSEVTNNVGGWQSHWRTTTPRQLHSFFALCRGPRAADPVSARGCWAWQALKERLALHVERYAESLAGPGAAAWMSVSLNHVWAMVNERGDANARHGHETNSVAGCYYLAGSDVGANTPGAHTPGRSDATANLMDAARSYDEAEGPPGWGGVPLAYDPRPVPGSGRTGSVALFPGFVEHETPAHEGFGLRIAVCFNASLTAPARPRRWRRGWWRPAFGPADAASFLARRREPQLRELTRSYRDEEGREIATYREIHDVGRAWRHAVPFQPPEL